MLYAFNVRPIIKTWYKGKVFTAESNEHKRFVYCITNCVVEQGYYYPKLDMYKHNIYLDVIVSEYYMYKRNNKWAKMTKPSSASIRLANDYIRSMILRDKKLEMNIFGLDYTKYIIKVRNIKWDIKYDLGGL